MPDTVTTLRRYARNINARNELPRQPLSLDSVFVKVRQLLIDVPLPNARVALAVWLCERLTGDHPEIVTIVKILNYDPEAVGESPQVHHHMTEKIVMDAIRALQQRPEKGKTGKGILVANDKGDRISLNSSLKSVLDKL